MVTQESMFPERTIRAGNHSSVVMTIMKNNADMSACFFVHFALKYAVTIDTASSENNNVMYKRVRPVSPSVSLNLKKTKSKRTTAIINN